MKDLFQEKALLKRIFHKLKYFYAIKPITIAINFAIVAHLARQLGIEEYGIFVLILSACGLIMTALELRTNEAIGRFFLIAIRENNKDIARGYLLISLGLELVLAIVLVALAALFSSEISHFLFSNQNTSKEIFIYLASGAFLFLGGTTSAVLQIQEKFFLINFLDMLHKAFRLVWILLDNISISSVIIGYAVSNIFYWLCLLGFALPSAITQTSNSTTKITIDMVKTFTSFTLTTFTSSFLKLGQRDVDKLILGIFANPSVVGLYDILKRLAGVLPWIVFPVGIAAYPTVIKMYHEGQYNLLHARIVRASTIAFGASIASGIILVLSLPIIENIFNISASIENLILLTSLIIAYVMTNVLWFVRPLTNAIGQPMLSVKMNALMSLLFISLLFALVPEYEIFGVVIAFLLSTMIVFAGWIRIYWRLYSGWRK